MALVPVREVSEDLRSILDAHNWLAATRAQADMAARYEPGSQEHLEWLAKVIESAMKALAASVRAAGLPDGV